MAFLVGEEKTFQQQCYSIQLLLSLPAARGGEWDVKGGGETVVPPMRAR